MQRLSRDPNSDPSSSRDWRGDTSLGPVSSLGQFRALERPDANGGLTITGGRGEPTEARLAPALTLSSWATWAFCRYTEYRTAVTTELVPRRMNWPSEGRPPLSMAARNPECRRRRRGQGARPPHSAALRPGSRPHTALPEASSWSPGGSVQRRGRKWAGPSGPEDGVAGVIARLPRPSQGRGLPSRGEGRGGWGEVRDRSSLVTLCPWTRGAPAVMDVLVSPWFRSLWFPGDIGLFDGFLMAPVNRLRGKKTGV